MRYFDSRGKGKEKITGVLEIRLCRESWGVIEGIAEARGVSYSWVVRYLLFRFIKRGNISSFVGFAGNPRYDVLPEPSRFGAANLEAWRRRDGASLRGAKHRHRLCLYGKDELYIRLATASLGCTMTHLVRLALEVYLLGLSSSKGRRTAFYWLGVKHYKAVKFHSRPGINTDIRLKRYSRSAYH